MPLLYLPRWTAPDFKGRVGGGTKYIHFHRLISVGAWTSMEGRQRNFKDFKRRRSMKPTTMWAFQKKKENKFRRHVMHSKAYLDHKIRYIISSKHKVVLINTEWKWEGVFIRSRDLSLLSWMLKKILRLNHFQAHWLIEVGTAWRSYYPSHPPFPHATVLSYSLYTVDDEILIYLVASFIMSIGSLISV